MANLKISELPTSGALSGAELVEIVQGGVNKQSTTQDIANLGGAGGGHTIEEEGTPLTQRTKLNFVGAGVTVTDDSGDDATVVTIPTGGSGTVNSGTQYRIAHYATTGTAVSEAAAITAARALKSDANGVPTHFDTATEPSLTELSYVKGATSNLQTQIDSLVPFSIVNYTASHILVIGDAGDLVEMEVGTDNTLTIPPNSDVAFPVNTVIEGVQKGAGQTTITPGSGVTILSKGSYLKTVGQYSPFCLVKIATNTWYAFGDLTA